MSAIIETDTRVRLATRATYAAFIGSGFAMASWATRIPQIRDGLGLTPSRLGLVLLAIAAGSIVSLVLAGQIVSRFGSARTIATMAALLGIPQLGSLFTQGFQLRLYVPLLTGILLCVVLAIVFDGLIIWLNRLLTPWRQRTVTS